MLTAVERDLIVVHPLLGEASQYPSSPRSVRLAPRWRVGDLRNYRLLLLEAGHDEGGGGGAQSQLNP